jgi:hypothetical protein
MSGSSERLPLDAVRVGEASVLMIPYSIPVLPVVPV